MITPNFSRNFGYTCQYFSIRLEIYDNLLCIEDIEVFYVRKKIGTKVINILKYVMYRFKLNGLIATEVKNIEEAQEFWKFNRFTSETSITYTFYNEKYNLFQ